MYVCICYVFGSGVAQVLVLECKYVMMTYIASTKSSPTNCVDFDNIHQNFYTVSYLKDLFHNSYPKQ